MIDTDIIVNQIKTFVITQKIKKNSNIFFSHSNEVT